MLERKRGIWTDACSLGLIFLVWLASLWVVNPLGEFPLNDDWSFAGTVERWLETGEFRPLGWAAMPLLTHSLWGALFCLPEGFSFTALRLSTLTLAWVGVLGTWLLVRTCGGSRAVAGLAALSLAFNPVYYVLSSTFMTDVPFVALFCLGALALVRHLRSGGLWSLALGLGLSIAAVLSRQLALALPLALGLSWLLAGRLRPSLWPVVALPVVLVAGVLLGFEHWMEINGRTPALYGKQTADMLASLRMPHTLIAKGAEHLLIALLYLGLAMLPLALAHLGSPGAWTAPQRRRFWWTAGVSALLLGAVVLRLGWSMPMPRLGNILVETGLGPVTLRDVFILQFETLRALPPVFWWGVTVCALVGAALTLGVLLPALPGLLGRSGEASEAGARARALLFLLLLAAAYLTPLLIAGYFDRYLLPLIPLVAAAFVCARGSPAESSAFAGTPGVRPALAAAPTVLCLLGLMIYSVAGTRDYLHWNALRWEVLNGLTAKGVRPERIDGGFEFNGRHLYRPGFSVESGRSWWWVAGDEYALAFGRLPGYEPVSQHWYRQWLPPGDERLVLQHRAEAGSAPLAERIDN